MSATRSARIAIDGGSRGNPGDAGCGIVIDLGAEGCERHTLFLGTATNNVAEYAALLAALERARTLAARDIEVRSDSELLVKQMKGSYRVRAPHLQPLWLAAAELARTFSRVRFVHVRREENTAADRLANQAMDSRTSTLPRPRALA